MAVFINVVLSLLLAGGAAFLMFVIVSFASLSMKSNKSENIVMGIGLVIVLVVAITTYILSRNYIFYSDSTGSGTSRDTEYSATCQSCDRTFSYSPSEYGGTAHSNVRCIRNTNMCKNCYENYCWSVGKKPKDY